MPQYGGSPDSQNRPERSAGVPIGAIIATGISATPLGYLPCDGTLYAVGQFPQLYAVIKNTHGGTANVNFNAPNYNNRFLRCHDTMDSRTAAANLDFGPRSAQAAGGSAGGVGSVQGHAIQGHWHEIWAGGRLADGGHGADYTGPANTPQPPRLENYLPDGVNGTPQQNSETRPINSTVSFFVRAY